MLFFDSLQNLTIGLIWHCFHLFGSKPNNGSDLAGDEGGVGGRRGGGWAREAGKGGEMGGGAPESSVGATRGVHWFHFLGSLKNLTIGPDLAGDEGGWGGGLGGVGQGGGQGGEMGGGHQRAVWEQQGGVHCFHVWN